MKNQSACLMMILAMAGAACGGEKDEPSMPAGENAPLTIQATAPAADSGESALVPVVAWELSSDYEGDAEFALQDLKLSNGQLSLDQPAPATTLEMDDKLLEGSFALGYLALAPAQHPALIADELKQDGREQYAFVAQDHAVIYVSKPQPAQSFVAGFYNAYQPLAAGLHLIRFRNPTPAEAAAAEACEANATAAALAQLNAAHHTSYADEDALYDDVPVGANPEAAEALFSEYEDSLDAEKLSTRCMLGRAVGKTQPAGVEVDLRIATDGPFVDWD